jgi:YVTN family beta-propeller protein
VEGVEERPGKVHYYIGNDPSKWHRNIPTFSKVRYRNVYPGIDHIFYGKGQEFEHDFIVAPGANPAAIRLAFEGADRTEIDPEGHLVLHTNAGQVRLRKPAVYQVANGRRRYIPAGYVRTDTEARFQLARYDTNRPLVIDPFVEVYYTYLGGSGDENNKSGTGGVAVDAQGRAHVVGKTDGDPITQTQDFPASGAPLMKLDGDVFVSKFNASGSDLEWSVFVGGGDDDEGNAIAVDASGNVYAVGDTQSGDFPTKNGYPSAMAPGATGALLVKLDASTGSMLYGTVITGATQAEAFGVAVTPNGQAFIAGQVLSSGLPSKSPDPAGPLQGYQGNIDYFVAKLDPTKVGEASLVYLTYLGGSGFEQTFGQLVAVDPEGYAYVTGLTNSGDFPKKNSSDPDCAGGLDAFVVKLNQAGSGLVYRTCLPATKGDSIAVDATGNAYVTGTGALPTFPVNNPLPNTSCSGSSFVTKFSYDASTSTLSMPFSSCVNGEARDIAIDGKGRIYLVDMMIDPSKPEVIYSGLGPGVPPFTKAGNVDVDVDNSCNAYVTGRTENNVAAHGPLAPFQKMIKGAPDAYVAKIGKAGPYAYITNYFTGTVTVIDTASNTFVDLDPNKAGTQAEITVGSQPFGVAVVPVNASGDTRVYVANEGSNTVSVIDSITHTVTKTLTGFQAPIGVAASPSADRVFVTNNAGDSVTVLSTFANAIDATISPNPVPVGDGPVGVAVANVDGTTKAYVANRLGNSVSVITLSGGSATVQTLTSNFFLPYAVAVAKGKVYVTNTDFVTVLNASTGAFIKTVDVGDAPFGAAASPDGSRVYVTNSYPLGLAGGNSVSVIDTSSDTVIDTGTVNGQIEVGGDPQGITVHPDGSRIYVANKSTYPSNAVIFVEHSGMPPGDPPGDDVGQTISVIDTKKNFTVAFLDPDPNDNVFPNPVAFGHFIGPLPLVDKDCIPLQPLMIAKNLEYNLTEVGQKKLFNPLRRVSTDIQRARYDRVQRRVDKFIRKVQRKLPSEAAQPFVSQALAILETLPGS